MADPYDPEDAAEFQLVILHNTVSGKFSVECHSKNRLVSLGMLEYAKQLINRKSLKQSILDEMKNRPMVVPPGGFPQ